MFLIRGLFRLVTGLIGLLLLPVVLLLQLVARPLGLLILIAAGLGVLLVVLGSPVLLGIALLVGGAFVLIKR